ncbi:MULTISPECIES: hypothetical protein [Brevibacillus]|uniref:hypothetical protein n=1 Tax=Brevibacillus TaxID=55080 RepID=UPI000EE4E6CD|nr:hypothetical protein [Brevibacillus sp.]HBZ80248.1 hypothetical protein [Brevibacillus sp.]
MFVTINQIQKQAFPKKNLIQIKTFLHKEKQKGTIFFRDNIFELTEQTAFNLYYCVHPGCSCIDAFPIPIKDFQYFKRKADEKRFLKNYFERYYQQSLPSRTINQYEFHSPYVGSEYVWVYKKVGARKGST